MNFKLFLTFISLHVIFFCCSSTHPITKTGNVLIKGKVIDGTSQEDLIGLVIREHTNQLNSVMTDVNGEFELLLTNEIPFVQLNGFGETIYVEISLDSYNNIIVDQHLLKESKKISRKLKKHKKN